MDDVGLTSSVLAKLHGLGVRLAIDDFGTGHSSLGYLARFPIDVIKIDQSFVRDIDRDPVKSAIVSAVVALSKAIGSTTVVEGIETLPELQQVQGLGCDAAQGFYFSRPLPAAAFGELLRSGPPSHPNPAARCETNRSTARSESQITVKPGENGPKTGRESRIARALGQNLIVVISWRCYLRSGGSCRGDPREGNNEDSGSRRPRNRAVRGRTRPVPAAAPARVHPRRRPFRGDRPDQGRHPGRRGVVAPLPQVTLTNEQPAGEGLATPMEVAGETLWLAMSGRDGSEAFDDADVALLRALASVGAIALANADFYGKVQQEKEKLEVITSSLAEGVCAISEAGEITFMNPSGAGMLGWYRRGVAIDEASVLPASETPDFLLEPALRAIALGRNVTSYDTRFKRLDGSSFPVTMTASPVGGGAAPTGAVIVFRDTSERQAFEEQLARQAFQDALTGLANRRLFLDHLDHALLQADRTGSQVAVLFGDIDRFKVVNDNLGHQVGDELLRVIGDRLRRAVRAGDTLSRFGGDEFVILLEGITSADDASQVADAVLNALRDPITLSAGHEVVATMSIGVALSEQGKSRDELLRDADVAMYRVKERGRGGQFAMTDADRIGARSEGWLDLDTALHHITERGEVEIHYQPLVSLEDRRIVGAEALVRWNHPDHGILMPSQFIKVAEDNGTILPIGRMVLEQACRQVRSWHEEFGVALQIGVNLSARQFQQAALVDDVEGGVARHRHRPLAALPRDHREPGHGRRRSDHVHPDQPPRPRRARRHRRLRDGALVARIPGPLPHRRREDRPELRARHRPGPRQVGHRLRRRRALGGHRLDDGGRGRRDAGPVRGAQEPRL